MADKTRLFASSPRMMHEARSKPESPMRLMPNHVLPRYAYLPGGRFPHPVRDPAGHSYGEVASPPSEPSLTCEVFRWGADLFNNGYYWEAHEAWEPLWRAGERRDPRRALLKGLILLAAAGVKVREGKAAACAKHARRAAALLRLVAARAPDLAALDMTAACLARHAEAIATRPPLRPGRCEPEPVFDFVLRPEPQSAERGSRPRTG